MRILVSDASMQSSDGVGAELEPCEFAAPRQPGSVHVGRPRARRSSAGAGPEMVPRMIHLARDEALMGRIAYHCK
jgi:hypothetical protein